MDEEDLLPPVHVPNEFHFDAALITSHEAQAAGDAFDSNKWLERYLPYSAEAEQSVHWLIRYKT